MCQLKESKQYIQGVAWDPLGKYVATLSTDRNLRIYCVEQKFKCIHAVDKLSLLDSKQFRLWQDEGSNSFFRRLSFSPDGSFLIVPGKIFRCLQSFWFALSTLSDMYTSLTLVVLSVRRWVFLLQHFHNYGGAHHAAHVSIQDISPLACHYHRLSHSLYLLL